MKEKLKEQKKKSDLAKTEDGKGGIDTIAKAQDKAAMKKLKIGPTYYPQSQNEIQARLKSAFEDKDTASKNKINNFSGQHKAHKKKMEKFFDRGLPAGEIAKLDKEFNARLERSIKNEQRRLSIKNRAAYKKQKNTIPDTGSAFAKGGKASKMPKSGGRTGYSVGGRAMRGVSKILMKK